MLTSSSGTNYVLNEHEDIGQYGPYVILSEVMPWHYYVPNEHEDVDQYDSFALPSVLMLYQSHPESLVNQNEILIELSC